MIKSTISPKGKEFSGAYPKLMKNVYSGAICLVHESDAWAQTITGTFLYQGDDASLKLGSRHTYDNFLFEDFDGTLTLTNGD